VVYIPGEMKILREGHTHICVCVCGGGRGFDPIKKLHILTDRQTDRGGNTGAESPCTHTYIHILWHKLVLTYAIKLSRKLLQYTQSTTLQKQSPNEPAEMFAFCISALLKLKMHCHRRVLLYQRPTPPHIFPNRE